MFVKCESGVRPGAMSVRWLAGGGRRQPVHRVNVKYYSSPSTSNTSRRVSTLYKLLFYFERVWLLRGKDSSIR